MSEVTAMTTLAKARAACLIGWPAAHSRSPLIHHYWLRTLGIEGGGGLGLTYVTGALVKVGQYLAVAVTGGDRLGWVPNLLLWAALAAGGVCGAAAYHWINLAAIWFAAGAALGLSAILAATIHL